MHPAPIGTAARPARGRRIRQAVAGTIRLSWESARAEFIQVAVLTIGGALVAPAALWMGRRFINQIADGRGEPFPLSVLMPTVLILGALAALQRIFNELQGYRQEIFSRRVNLGATLRFVDKASRTDLGHFDDASWHDRVQRASEDIGWRPFQLTYQTIGLAGAAITFTGMLGVLLSLHPLLVVLGLASALLPVPIERRINRKVYDFFYEETAKDRERWHLRWLLSDPRPAKDIRAFDLQENFIERYRTLAMEWHQRMRALYNTASRTAVLSALIGGGILTGAYFFVASRGAAGTLPPGDVAALIGAIASLTAQVGSISNSLLTIDQHATFLGDYFGFLAVEQLVPPASDPVPLPARLDGGIRFDDVTFSYRGREEPAVANLSLAIEPGELIAFVGDNGAGKTTLVKLLLRFYDPQKGRVLVGGRDIRDVESSELRSRIGVLFQDYNNYQFTVREDVSIGRVDAEASEERIWRAIEAARATDLVKRLPQQLDSIVGRIFEGGQDLSGGEWQRIALARLMFREADIWILDEPTSSLDPEAEAGIFSELKAQLHGRIGIVISHRFSTVRIADRIAVVQDGRITELGTHEDLLALGGRYAQLFELQAAGYR